MALLTGTEAKVEELTRGSYDEPFSLDRSCFLVGFALFPCEHSDGEKVLALSGARLRFSGLDGLIRGDGV